MKLHVFSAASLCNTLQHLDRRQIPLGSFQDCNQWPNVPHNAWPTLLLTLLKLKPTVCWFITNLVAWEPHFELKPTFCASSNHHFILVPKLKPTSLLVLQPQKFYWKKLDEEGINPYHHISRTNPLNCGKIMGYKKLDIICRYHGMDGMDGMDGM